MDLTGTKVMAPEDIFFHSKNMALPVYTEFLLRESSINKIGKKIFLSPRSLGNIGEAVAGLELGKKDYKIIANAAGFYLADMAAMEYQEYRFDIITVMIKRNILSRKLGAIIPDKPTREGISRIAAAIIDGCIIEHIEAAF